MRTKRRVIVSGHVPARRVIVAAPMPLTLRTRNASRPGVPAASKVSSFLRNSQVNFASSGLSAVACAAPAAARASRPRADLRVTIMALSPRRSPTVREPGDRPVLVRPSRGCAGDEDVDTPLDPLRLDAIRTTVRPRQVLRAGVVIADRLFRIDGTVEGQAAIRRHVEEDEADSLAADVQP